MLFFACMSHHLHALLCHSNAGGGGGVFAVLSVSTGLSLPWGEGEF